MPEARLQRTRESLPDGYQFGRHVHDYRARWCNEWSAYRSICGGCGHDAGEITPDGFHLGSLSDDDVADSSTGTTLHSDTTDREVKLAVAELKARIASTELCLLLLKEACATEPSFVSHRDLGDETAA